MAKYSDGEVAQMKKWFIEDGLSATEIARKRNKGESRNAIIGILHRAGCKRSGQAPSLPGRRPIVRPKKRPKPADLVTVPALALPSAANASARAFAGKQGEARPASPIPLLNRAGKATLLELESGMCKNPVGLAGGADQRFCAEPIAVELRFDAAKGGKVPTLVGPYCPECAKLNYQPQTQRKERSFARGVRLALGVDRVLTVGAA